jgi:hypothetical protein
VPNPSKEDLRLKKNDKKTDKKANRHSPLPPKKAQRPGLGPPIPGWIFWLFLLASFAGKPIFSLA